MEDLIEKYKGYIDENLDEQLEEELDEQLEEELGERDAIITKALIQNEIKSTTLQLYTKTPLLGMCCYKQVFL